MPTRQDEAMVVRTLAFMIVRQVLCLVGLGPSPDAKDVEIAVLRHQLLVLRRQVPRPRYTPSDRMILATLAKLLPRDRWPIFLVTPSTLLRWHRELVRRWWTYPTNGRRRRGLDPQVVDLVLRLARENPRWGYLRIVDECRKLGIRVTLCWPRPASRCSRLRRGRRRRNAFAERWVRTVRTECLDWVLICNRRHLERVLTAYVDHYNMGRPHRGIDLNMPVTSTEPPLVSIEQLRRVEWTDVLGGLIHEYRRAA
jgi:hypothetical protein